MSQVVPFDEDMEGRTVAVQKPDEEAPQGDAEESESGVAVGVLGWLGFFIVNMVAFGMVSVASFISWVFGFIVTLVYTAMILGLAFWLEGRGQVYRQFVNILWVLGTIFVFILGLFISINIIGGGSGSNTGGSGQPIRPGSSDLVALLPNNASQPLKNWANENSWNAKQTPTFITFQGNVFFSGRADGAEDVDALRRSDGSSIREVTPRLTSASSFATYRSSIYFIARSNTQGLWRISPTALDTATVVKEADQSSKGFTLSHLFADSATSLLYFKAELQCPDTCSDWGNTFPAFTIFKSDGTTSGTVDLQGDTCTLLTSSITCDTWEGGEADGKPSRATLYGVLFVAALPMIALASVVLVRKQMPGLFFNIFGGIICVVVVIYLLANYDDDDLPDLPNFLKWFITVYTSVLWIAIIAWSLLKEEQDLPQWQQDLKSWAAAVVGVSFFIIIHIDLEIPFTPDAWRWVVYALLTVLQILTSAIVSRSVPMVTGAIGTFVLAWKIAYELVEFADFAGSEMKMLTVLAIVGLQGIGIIVAAVFYSRQREQIENLIRGFLVRGEL